MIKIKRFTFNPWQENSYVVYNESGECILVDMGCMSQGDFDILKQFIDNEGLEVKYIVNTLLHIDHI